jgi:hypothetical protein
VEHGLLDIFQTTSVVEFNATFRVMRIQQRTLGMNFVRSEIMNIAESLYSDLSSNGEWNGVANPGDDSVFFGHRETVCWDCGETGHRAGDTRCKRPKKHSQPNPDVTEKVQAPEGPIKWTAPKEGDSNEKVICGRPYIWNAQRHRWWRKKRNTGDTENLAEVSTDTTTEPDDTSTRTSSQAGGTTTTGARASFAAAFHAGTATAAARARSSGRRHALLDGCIYLKLLWGALSMCTGHPFTPSKGLHPRGETEALFYGILSAALHFDQYVPIRALLVAFILTSPLVVERCHGSWFWAL